MAQGVGVFDANRDPVGATGSEIDLIQTTDARMWATEFMARWQHRLEEVDEGLMLVWFANAIETGRTAGQAGRQ